MDSRPAAAAPDAEGFLSLWPTQMLQRRIPGHEVPNAHLRALVLATESSREQMTTDYLRENLFAMDHPALQWLRQCVNKTVGDYLERLGIAYPVNWTLQGWANVNRFGDYHDLHNHPHSYLSGTYYVAVPEQDRSIGRRDDLAPGAISFYDPRPQANMLAIRDDGEVRAAHLVMPAEGTILLWPAFLHHLVHPNHAQEPRVSISFNVVLKWSEAYLPAR